MAEGDIDTTALTPLTLTQIHYNSDSHLSLLSAYLSLLPLAILISLGTAVLITREIEFAFALLGQLVNEGFNVILKRYFKGERPELARKIGGRGYGMPSSHAQFSGFLVAWWVLWCWLRAGKILPVWKKVVISAALTATGAGIGIARVGLSYHTPEQVLVGWAIGAAAGVAWYVATGLARQWTWAWDMGMWAWGLFHGRDMCWQVDLVKDGYTRWIEIEEEKAKRKAK